MNWIQGRFHYHIKASCCWNYFLISLCIQTDFDQLNLEKNMNWWVKNCVGFDSDCVRRQMDNFVKDLISAHHDCNPENLIIWGWTSYFQNSPRPLKFRISTPTSGRTSDGKKIEKNFIAPKFAPFRGTFWGQTGNSSSSRGRKSLKTHLWTRLSKIRRNC